MLSLQNINCIGKKINNFYYQQKDLLRVINIKYPKILNSQHFLNQHYQEEWNKENNQKVIIFYLIMDKTLKIIKNLKLSIIRENNQEVYFMKLNQLKKNSREK